MQAILIAPDNFEAILETETSIATFNLPDLAGQVEEGLYYIPRFDGTKHAYTGWATYPEPVMSETFDFDKDAAKTSFVEIARKQ